MDLNKWKKDVERAEKAQKLKFFHSLSCQDKLDLVCMFLKENRSRWTDLIKMYLKEQNLFLTLATFLEEKDNPYYWASPSLFEAAEAYEKAGKLEKALSLYQQGVKLSDPYNMTTYDENTGGEVSIMDYFESNQGRIEEAFLCQEQCEKKAKEIKKIIKEREKYTKKARKECHKKKNN